MSDEGLSPDAAAPRPAAHEPKPPLFHGVPAARSSPIAWMRRHQAKVAEQMERNRRGEYTVPTWVLTVVLVSVVAGFAALIIFG